MMSCYEKLSADWICGILQSLRWYVEFVSQSRTLLVTTGTLDLEKNPPCNPEDNLRTGLIVIEAWFRGY